MAEILIYACISLYFTPFIIYPLLLSFYGVFRKNIHIDSFYPTTSTIQPFTLVLTVHNEEESILRAIENIISVKEKLGSDYMKVIIASDHSTDQTNVLVQEYADDILLVENYLEPGKTNAQLVAIENVDTDIVLLTDCGTRYDVESVINLLRVFEDQRIGGATGNLRIPLQKTGLSLLQNLHWMAETHIRKCQSALGVLSTGTGAFLAFRRKHVERWSNFVGDDCFIPLCIVSKKAKFVFVENACVHDNFSSTPEGEATARARMINRNLSETLRFLLQFYKQKRYALCINMILHKILRWLGPAFLICTLPLALIFNSSNISIVVMSLWIACIVIMLIGYVQKNVITVSLNMFIKINLYMVKGLITTLKTQRVGQYDEKTHEKKY